MIPKIIWQTHELKYENLPSFQKNIINTWINLNPSWKHVYADADQRAKDVENFDKILYKSYLTEPKVTQADMWRYIMVYQNGGVYADMDSVCKKPLDYFIDSFYKREDMICTHTYEYKDSSGIDTLAVNNSNFAAVENSKILRLVVEDIKFAYRMMLEGFIPGPMVPLKYTCWDSFHKNVIENKDLALFDFDCGLHDEGYKKVFNDYLVDFHGKQTLYSELCKENSWQIL